jgi:lysozyme family protein
MIAAARSIRSGTGPIRSWKGWLMVGFSYGELREEYADLWGAMKIPAGTASALDARIRAIARGRPRYDKVANATGVTWYVIAIIHEMEASLKFTTHLHHGDPLTDRTVQVPAGRPP